MRLPDVLRLSKSNINIGPWNRGRIARSDFPLSRARAKNYRFGQEYIWRVISFECEGEQFRILLLFNGNKNIYRATLGIEKDKSLAVLCHHEYHASEPGWHCHFTLEEHDKVPVGQFRWWRMRRWPSARVAHKHMQFGVTQASALTVAAERYRFRAQGDLL
jgi:hypothetical protein